MSSYIRCPECSFPLGKYADFFDKAKDALFADTIFKKGSQHANYDPEKISLNPNITPPLEGIFNALEISNMCCRMHLVSAEKFDEMYK